MTTAAVLAFGELGQAVATTAVHAGAEVRVWNRRGDTDRGRVLARRARDAGAHWVEDLAEAVTGADVVLACVPGAVSLALAGLVVPALTPGGLYVDAASAAPEAKEAAARLVEARGCGYADAAVLGSVAALGGEVPFLAAGGGAERFAALAGRLGLTVDVLEGAAGRAARLKLLRSVWLKGRDALVAEMLVAAAREGVVDELVRSIGGPAEQVPFVALAERIGSSLARHAGRRAEELQASADLLRQLGVEPAAAEGAVRRLRLLDATALDDVVRATRRDPL